MGIQRNIQADRSPPQIFRSGIGRGMLRGYVYIFRQPIPQRGLALGVRIDLAPVEFGFRSGLRPGRCQRRPRRSIIHLRDRFPMVEPKLLPRRVAFLGHDRPRAGETLHDIHREFGRRLQQHLFFARFQVYRHQIPGGNHPAGDIGVRVIHAHLIAAPGAVGMAGTHPAEVLDDLAQFRVVDIQPNLIAPSSRAVNSPVRSQREWTHLAAEPGHDLAAFLQRVGRRVVDK